MSQPFVGEIRVFFGTFAPLGWALCNGQLTAISENQALFALIGTTYGGDGVTTFALPNMQSRMPIHAGTGGGATYVPGQLAGAETVTLTTAQMPAHTHIPSGTTGNGTVTAPAGAIWAADPENNPSNDTFLVYSTNTTGTVQMNAGAVSIAGGSQPHDNMPPYVTVNFIIATVGVFPTQS